MCSIELFIAMSAIFRIVGLVFVAVTWQGFSLLLAMTGNAQTAIFVSIAKVAYEIRQRDFFMAN